MPDGIQSGRGAVAVRTVTAIWALFAPDTFAPLRATTAAVSIEDPGYQDSFR
jgi:hypothetical protein